MWNWLHQTALWSHNKEMANQCVAHYFSKQRHWDRADLQQALQSRSLLEERRKEVNSTHWCKFLSDPRKQNVNNTSSPVTPTLLHLAAKASWINKISTDLFTQLLPCHLPPHPSPPCVLSSVCAHNVRSVLLLNCELMCACHLTQH